MTFPKTKKEAVRRAAFFSYFLAVAPKLSELMVPLRKLAQPKSKFNPTDKDRDAFEKLKQYLMDPEVGAIRMPSNRQTDTLIVWTDSSCNTISALVTQLLPPLPGSKLDPTKKYLTIVGCFSRTIDENWTSYPIWVLELIALEEATRKFRWLLAGRVFYALTDSTTVRSWSSIEIVPKDIARKIIRLQSFNYRLLFIEGRLNPSDWMTRLPVENEPVGHHPRFVENRIYNGKGERMDWKKLFSQRRCDEAVEFFTRNRRQAMSHAVTPRPDEDAPEEVDDRMERMEMLEALTATSPYEGEIGREAIKQCTTGSIAAFGLSDEEVDGGNDEETADTPIDDDIGAKQKLEEFHEARREQIRQLQENDSTIEYIRDAMEKEKRQVRRRRWHYQCRCSIFGRTDQCSE